MPTTRPIPDVFYPRSWTVTIGTTAPSITAPTTKVFTRLATGMGAVNKLELPVIKRNFDSSWRCGMIAASHIFTGFEPMEANMNMVMYNEALQKALLKNTVLTYRMRTVMENPDEPTTSSKLYYLITMNAISEETPVLFNDFSEKVGGAKVNLKVLDINLSSHTSTNSADDAGVEIFAFNPALNILSIAGVNQLADIDNWLTLDAVDVAPPP